jgi:hypothetical protein
MAANPYSCSMTEIVIAFDTKTAKSNVVFLLLAAWLLFMVSSVHPFLTDARLNFLFLLINFGLAVCGIPLLKLQELL